MPSQKGTMMATKESMKGGAKCALTVTSLTSTPGTRVRVHETGKEAPKMLRQKRNKKILIALMAWIGIVLLVVGYRNQAEFNTYVKNMVIHLDFHRQTSTDLGPEVIFNRTTGGDGCRGFTDEPLHPSIIKYFKKKPTLSCKKISPNFLYVTDGGVFLKVDKVKIKLYRFKVDYCKYASLRRAEKDGDFKIVTSPWSKTFTESISLPKDVDNIKGQCFRGQKLVGVSYINIVRKNPEVEKVLKESYRIHVDREKPKETLSVLMMGIDGTSKLNFARQMPKTKSFVLDMGGIELYKLNKVGLNTFPNVMPLLTGHGENEVRKNWTDKEYFDKLDHLFLWEEARKAGYRTSVVLDSTTITSFHFLKKGWDKPKFHYYSRPVVVTSERDKTAKQSGRHCIGDVTTISLYYDYWLQLARTFNNTPSTPYFGYSFFALVTHDDINMASSVDEIYLGVFQKLVGQKSLNNTLVVFFSDHGSRYGTFRSTFRGMLEDSNPFMFFIFPPWFEVKYPTIMANFRKNQHRLVTNFDIHATLKDILYFQGDNITTKDTDRNKTRGLSLFQELPEQRTCEEAGIPIKYCNCRDFRKEGVTPEITETVSKQLLKEVIDKTKNVRSKCVVLSLNSTLSLMAIFTTSKTDDFYQATIQTSPGGGVYEATLKTGKKTKVTSVTGDIARTNMYRGQADCITDAKMRPFCYCRNLIP